jgi:hypothetical protein
MGLARGERAGYACGGSAGIRIRREELILIEQPRERESADASAALEKEIAA